MGSRDVAVPQGTGISLWLIADYPASKLEIARMQVSVIVPVYNSEAFLAEALQSVLNQTHRDFELIVLDDGSDDGSPEIAANFAQRDRRIILLNSMNQGAPSAANQCLHRANNELVVRLDADDIMLPQRLERQICFMEQHPDLSVATSYVWLINRWGAVIGRAEPYIDIDRGIKERKPDHFVNLVQPATIMRKSHILGVGGYPVGHPPCEDRELWGRLVVSGYRIDVQPEFLTKQRIHCGSLTGRDFHHNVIIGRFIDYNITRSLRAEPQVGFERFLREQCCLPLGTRLLQALHDWGKAHYRAATRHFAERHWWRFAEHGAVALCLRPLWGLRMFRKVAIRHQASV